MITVQMKKIILIRHGRAENQDPYITDFERSLTVKGKIISREMAKLFRKKEKNPGLIITSPAFRALETALIFADEFEIRLENVKMDARLCFRPGINHLFEILKSVISNYDAITLFGHNPSLTEMADRLSRDGFEFLTKTGIVCLSFPAESWAEIKLNTGNVEYFLKAEK
jgi:phosphohistidine phosphatase